MTARDLKAEQTIRELLVIVSGQTAMTGAELEIAIHVADPCCLSTTALEHFHRSISQRPTGIFLQGAMPIEIFVSEAT